jgi:hypothetical protein
MSVDGINCSGTALGLYEAELVFTKSPPFKSNPAITIRMLLTSEKRVRVPNDATFMLNVFIFT